MVDGNQPSNPPRTPRVMLVIHGLGMGGAEMMVKHLACALHDAGIPVEVVSLHSGDTPVAGLLRERGVKVVALEKHRGFDPGCVLKLKTEMAQFCPTIVHTHLPVLEYAAPAARLWGGHPKMVHTFHSVADKETRHAVLRLINRYEFVHGVIPVALNDEVQDSICRIYELTKSAVPIVPNGIELSAFREAGVSNKKTATFRLLCVARLEDVKNHALLLDALALALPTVNRPMELTVVGDGPLRSSLEERVNGLGLGDVVTFAGRRTDTETFYGAADLFVLVSKYEGLPMSVIEAMASGLPVLASNVGGLPGIVKPGVNGVLVEPDVHEVARALACLAEDEGRLSALSEGASRTAADYSSEKMMEGYLDLYR